MIFYNVVFIYDWHLKVIIGYPFSDTTYFSSQHPNSRGETEEQPRVNSNARPLSIEGPSNMNNTDPQVFEPLPNQPRQPTTVQGLLRFAVEAGNSQNRNSNIQLQPMDEEVGNINVY